MSANKKIAFVILGLISVTLLLLAYTSTGVMGGADSYTHHLIAKWAFVHPALFLDHWGKPVYTMLSAPFAQFGLMGSVVFNIILTVLSGWLAFKLALSLKWKNPLLAIFFTVFTPIFFLVSFSSLTETLFAFWLLWVVYLWAKEEYKWSVVLLSLIPFIRTEGILFYPLIVIALWQVNRIKWSGLLLIGGGIFSLLRVLVFKDVLWFFNRNPYSLNSSLYGSGDYLHFINELPMLFGWPTAVLFLVGALVWIKAIWNKPKSSSSALFLFVLSGAIGYVLAHSLVWGMGMGSSAGLVRVMAGVGPLFGLVAFVGFNEIIQKFSVNKFSQYILPILMGVTLVIEATTKHKLPIARDREFVVMEDVTSYILENNLQNSYIVYANPMVAYLLNLDHFESQKSSHTLKNASIPNGGLNKGDLVIWDAHFSPNENQLKKSFFMNNPNFKVLETFVPETSFQVFSGQDYEVVIYERIN
jgi:hypothetical protein